MSKGRLEAFSDAVIAIAITIMVLELKVPSGTDWRSLQSVIPIFLSYALSFVFLGIYWNNHHHMLHVTHRINGRILWANLHLLFWLSLFPFATRWMDEDHRAKLPMAVYGVVLLCAAIAYMILQTQIVALLGPDSKLAQAVGNDVKGKRSLAMYALAIPVAFVLPWASLGIYVAVALIWLAPDPRIESRLES